MKTATIVLAVVLTACSPAEKKTSAAEAERQLRLAASEVVKIEYQLASEKSPGMVSLLTEQGVAEAGVEAPGLRLLERAGVPVGPRSASTSPMPWRRYRRSA